MGQKQMGQDHGSGGTLGKSLHRLLENTQQMQSWAVPMFLLRGFLRAGSPAYTHTHSVQSQEKGP